MLVQMEKPIISAEDIQTVFQNTEELWRRSDEMVKDMEALSQAGPNFLIRQMGRTLIIHHANAFDLYRTYLENYDSAASRLADLRKSSAAFDHFCNLNDFCENTKLESLLILPVQRLPRYLLLLKEMEKQAPPGTEGVTDIQEAHKCIGKIASDINQCLHVRNCMQKVRALQDKFEKDSRYFDLVLPTRYIVKMGVLKKLFKGRTLMKGKYKAYHFFLFNDLLLYATKIGTKYNTKHSFLGLKVFWLEARMP